MSALPESYGDLKALQRRVLAEIERRKLGGRQWTAEADVILLRGFLGLDEGDSVAAIARRLGVASREATDRLADLVPREAWGNDAAMQAALDAAVARRDRP